MKVRNSAVCWEIGDGGWKSERERVRERQTETRSRRCIKGRLSSCSFSKMCIYLIDSKCCEQNLTLASEEVRNREAS